MRSSFSVFSVLLGFGVIFPVASFGEIKADFIMSRQRAGVGVAVALTSTSQLDNKDQAEFEWIIDGSILYTGQQSIIHSFARAGVYEITLVVRNQLGDEGKVSKTIEIIDNLSPETKIIADVKDVRVGEQFLAIAKSNNRDEKGKLITYWEINTTPPTTYKGKSFVHTFETAGLYEVAVFVEDSLGAVSTSKISVDVKPKNVPPRLNVEIPAEVEQGSKVTAHIKTDDPDGKVLALYWSIPGSGEMQVPVGDFDFVLPMSGAVNIKVRAEDDSGASTEIVRNVQVVNGKSEPTIQVSASKSQVKTGEGLLFQARISEKQKLSGDLSWDFGDGTVLVQNEDFAIHKYNTPGVFKVVLSISGKKGELVKGSIEVTVEDLAQVTTAPDQVVLRNHDYIEIFQTKRIYIDLDAYLSGSAVSPTGTVWNLTGSSAHKVYESDGLLMIEGDSPGTVTISATVGGVNSQVILISVLPLTSGSVVTKRGRFFGNQDVKVDHYVYEPCSVGPCPSYTLTHEFVEQSVTVNSYSGDTYIGSDYSIFVPDAVTEVLFKAKNLSSGAEWSYPKTELTFFNGRNGFLHLKDTSEALIDFKDDRFVRWDEDFSITYWALKTDSGHQPRIKISGLVNMNSSGQFGGAIFSGASSSKYVLPPRGSDFSNRWMHMGWVYESSYRRLTLYIDGEKIHSIVIPTSLSTSAETISFAATGVEGTAIDELRFWSIALNSTQMRTELFNPANISTAELLASFSFDSGINGRNMSENDSGWSYILTRGGIASAPQFKHGPIQIMDMVVEPTSRVERSEKIPFRGFGQGIAYIKFDKNVVTQSERLRLDVSSCMRDCIDEASHPNIRSRRLSPYFAVSALKSLTNSFLFKIPFDVSAVSPADIKKIKVVAARHSFFEQDFFVLEPKTVNLLEGYVTVDPTFTGIFWVAIPTDHETKVPIYSNQDLKPNAVSAFGYRLFYAYLPDSQSTYSLTGSALGNFEQASCLTAATITPAGGGTPSFPIGVANLQMGTNQCVIWHKVDTGSYKFYFSADIVMLARGTP